MCVDYDQDVDPGIEYIGSPAYGYEYIVLNPHVTSKCARSASIRSPIS